MPNDELLTSFLQEAEEVMTELTSSVDGLQHTAGNDAERMGQSSILAHRMRGSSALYGFPQLSMLAGLLERLLNARPELQGERREQFMALLVTVTQVLRGGLAQVQMGGNDNSLGLTFTRVGGTEQMQALLKVMPEAFQMRAPLYAQPHELEPANPESANPEAANSAEAELQSFVKENSEIWDYFAPEVQEHITALREQLALGDHADINIMFRSAHTIKGSSFMVGLPVLGNFAHRTEDLLGALREGALGLTTEVSAQLGHSVDLLDDMMQVANGASIALRSRLAHAEAVLRALATGQALTGQALGSATIPDHTPETTPPNAAPTSSTIRVPAQKLEGLLDQVSELVAARARVTRLLARLQDLESGMQGSQQRFQRTVRDFEERYLNPDMVRTSASGHQEAGAAMGHPITEQFADLEFDTYNDLNILSRSITELAADFSEVRRHLTDTVAELHGENEQLGKLVRQLRVDVNQTSRVPFAQATARLRRWARERQDDFDLHIAGDDLLIESSILQRIADPLMHLLTNALTHGTESAASRASTGKPARSQVWIRAAEQNNLLEVTVADDGQGLDLERIKQRTLEKGLLSAQELATLNDSDAARLVLLPGLSTAQEVGQVAGRGVGMDVVATNVRQLGGELLIQSGRGLGTAFTLRLPTTQRIMDVLQVQVGHPEQWAAFAVHAIRALRDVPEAELISTSAGWQVMFEHERVPVVDARAIWGFAGIADGLARLVFLSSVAGTLAVRVAEFGQIEEVSVTPPGPSLARLDYLAGLTTSAGGAALPILDPAGLLRLSRRPATWLQPDSPQTSPAGSHKRILLVDDSLSVRKLVGRMLERAHFQVVTANDGQAALDILQLDSGFDGVITDLEMPRMNGYELITALRSRPESQALPLLVMTTRAGDKHQRLAFQLGANDYFTKPVNEALLLRRLDNLLGKLPGRFLENRGVSA